MPYSWAPVPADASLQCSFRGDSNQASAYPRLSGGQPSLETVPNTVGLSQALHGPPTGEELVEHGSNLLDEGEGDSIMPAGSTYMVCRPQITTCDGEKSPCAT